jgi:hypothetical protein
MAALCPKPTDCEPNPMADPDPVRPKELLGLVNRLLLLLFMTPP